MCQLSKILKARTEYFSLQEKHSKYKYVYFINRSREFSAGASASLQYVTMFVSNKTYLDLESALSMPGVTILYGAFGLVG